MPELPDVRVFKQYLDATSLHQRIKKVEVYSRQMLKGISVSRLKSRLEGHSFEYTRCHGKYLFVSLDSGNWLVLHFGMTGFVKYFKARCKSPSHERMLIGFTNGYHLAYDCQRKLGEINLIEDLEGFIAERDLGPDALDPSFDFEAFKEVLTGKRSTAKSALMNQKIIAGVGNVYSDEILFQAALHPKTKVNHLDAGRLQNLFQAIKAVLRTAIDCRADPEQFPTSCITPHRRRDQKCPRCGRGDLKHSKISGRTAYYCPHCQGNERDKT